MKKNKFLILAFLILSFACSKNEDPDAINDSSQSLQTLVHDNTTREYFLYVPSSYDGTSEFPLLLNFHGFGGEVSDYMSYADMRSVAEVENFILVYPQGSLLQGVTHWNPSLPSSDNKSDADDLGFIETLINQISSDYKIDSERVYACGYSNGAMMSYGLAAHKSDLIAAVGSISGAMLDTDVTSSHPMPVIIIHGTSDGVLPYNGSSDYSSIESTINFWTTFNATATTPIFNSENDNGTTIEHYLYDQGNNGVSVEHYKVIEGEHVWFDINYQANNTSSLIWNFVSKYDINGLRR